MPGPQDGGTPPGWTLAAVSYACADARRLTRALQREQAGLYGFADDPAGTPPAEFTAPHGSFLVARTSGGAATACGGWRTAGAATAEIKRMYVDPPARRQGLGRCILRALEEDAASYGLSRVILETGVGNRAALSLYLSCGYVPVRSYAEGRDPAINRAMLKTLPRRS